MGTKMRNLPVCAFLCLEWKKYGKCGSIQPMNDITSSRTLSEIRDDRLAKIARMKEQGIDPYPSDSRRTHTVGEARGSFDSFLEGGQEVTIAGRIMALREHGGSIFCDLYDGTAQMQVYLKKDTVGDEAFDSFTAFVDRGDFIEAAGTCFVTKKGEPSILVSGWRMLAKSLQPVPDSWYGLKDEDERYRKRYLDILLSPERTEMIRRRSVFWNTARDFLLSKNFVEVETPVLETTTGGAEARPFVTHHNALDIDVYLRISAGELWQKKLMVAGIPRTFEIGRIFRNEGMSHEHLQDYTQLEFYMAYSDYAEGMEMISNLYRNLAQKTFGTLQFTIGDQEVDLGAQWQQYDFCKLMQDAYGFDPRTVTESEAQSALEKAGIAYDKSQPMYLERAVDTLWKNIRRSLIGPGFLVNVPVYLEPLAKRSRSDERVVERFQVILGGSEMGKGFSELNDPEDQRQRFARQEELRTQGDDEAQMNDTSFVEALEYGMPPTFGFGVSERLFAVLSGVSVREAQIFPLMRPRNSEEV